MSFAAWRLETEGPRVHAQTQKLYLSTARQFKTSYKGSAHALGAIAGRPSALAMASADLDGDAVNDLAIGFAAAGSGLIAIHRGNLDAFAPQSQASFEAIGRGEFPPPFLPEAELVEIPSRPDFLAAGDLIGQSGWHWPRPRAADRAFMFWRAARRERRNCCRLSPHPGHSRAWMRSNSRGASIGRSQLAFTPKAARGL